MIFLGISAILRVFRVTRIVKDVAATKREIQQKTHGKFALFSGFNRSFFVGMFHGLAGTGAAVSIALTLSADNVYIALAVIVVQCLGILVAMTIYSLVLIRFIDHASGSHRKFLNYINILVGGFSLFIGISYLWSF